MKWLFEEERREENETDYRCSFCESVTTFKNGEELPHCEYCGFEPEEEQIAGEFPSNEEMKKRISEVRYSVFADRHRETLDLLEALWDRFEESRCSE